MSALTITAIRTSGKSEPEKINLETLQDSTLNGSGGFNAECGQFFNAFFAVSFDKVCNLTHVDIARLTYDGEYSFMATTTFEIMYNQFENKSDSWTEFKTVNLSEIDSDVTTIPLNIKARSVLFKAVEGDTSLIEAGYVRFFGSEDAASDNNSKLDAKYYVEKVAKDFKPISKGNDLTIPDHSKEVKTFKQEGESSVTISTPDLNNAKNREVFITAKQSSRGDNKFITWIILNDIVFNNPTQQAISISKFSFEYLDASNKWISLDQVEAGRNLGGYIDVYSEELKKLVKVHTFEIQNWEWFSNFTIDAGSSRSLHVQGNIACSGKVAVLDPPCRRVPESLPQPLLVRLTLEDTFGKKTELKVHQLNTYRPVRTLKEHSEIYKLRSEDFVIVCDDDFNKERVFVDVQVKNGHFWIQIISFYNSQYVKFSIDDIRELEAKKIESKTVLKTDMHKIKVDLLFDKSNNFKAYAVKVNIETETNSTEKVVPVVEIIEKIQNK